MRGEAERREFSLQQETRLYKQGCQLQGHSMVVYLCFHVSGLLCSHLAKLPNILCEQDSLLGSLEH